MKKKDASFTSLQDSEQKVLCFLQWLLDNIDINNMNMQQKAIKAPQTQLDHAVPALSCVKKCQMGIRPSSWLKSKEICHQGSIRTGQTNASTLGIFIGSLR